MFCQCFVLSCFLHLFFLCLFFFFNDTATTEIYTLSLHDALPICARRIKTCSQTRSFWNVGAWKSRSEEHTSELQSLRHLVCRHLLEKKKKKRIKQVHAPLTSAISDLMLCARS